MRLFEQSNIQQYTYIPTCPIFLFLIECSVPIGEENVYKYWVQAVSYINKSFFGYHWRTCNSPITNTHCQPPTPGLSSWPPGHCCSLQKNPVVPHCPLDSHLIIPSLLNTPRKPPTSVPPPKGKQRGFTDELYITLDNWLNTHLMTLQNLTWSKNLMVIGKRFLSGTSRMVGG